MKISRKTSELTAVPALVAIMPASKKASDTGKGGRNPGMLHPSSFQWHSCACMRVAASNVTVGQTSLTSEIGQANLTINLKYINEISVMRSGKSSHIFVVICC
ncbi:MAG: hypothetical protein GPOALKHO_000806 [Sodalis sp.]|nr:MAG: hypothetical protein GPOALKHO_000806 [Sodalis sp.]